MDQIFHRKTNKGANSAASAANLDAPEDDQVQTTVTSSSQSHGKLQVPLSQLELDKVIAILAIYAIFGQEAMFIDTFIDCTLIYEFDILVNEAEN